MGFSDEQIRDMLELKEELTEKIIKYKEQIEKLEKNNHTLTEDGRLSEDYLNRWKPRVITP